MKEYKGKVAYEIEARRVLPETAEAVAQWIRESAGVHTNITEDDNGNKCVTFIASGCFVIAKCGTWVVCIDGEFWDWCLHEEFEAMVADAGAVAKLR